jgi:type I restriction enzyme S subunit
MRSEPTDGWHEVRLGDVADVSWGDTLITKDAYIADGFPAFSASGPDGFLPHYDYDRSGVVLSAIGANCGRVYLAKGRWSCIKNTIRFYGYDGVMDTRFLYYATSKPSLWPRRGSVQPFISQGDARNVRLSAPSDIVEQVRIAAVLGAFDEKIDSNRRFVAVLEDAAATLFRARFVDFVGVDRFEESGIGQIPQGWRTGSLTDIARFVNGRAFTKEANTKGRPILRIKELNVGIRDDTPRTDIATTTEHVARQHDILFAWSGSLAAYRWSGPDSLINQHIFKVIPDNYPPWFVYHWMQLHMKGFQAIARDKATTMGHIQRRHLSESSVTLPDATTLAEANRLFEPIDTWQMILTSEAESLTAIRDTLLPKLVSGEIRVPDTKDPDEVIGPATEQLEQTAT